MLKLTNLYDVNQVACTRDVAIEKLRQVCAGEFVVTIGGREREGAEVKRLVQPVLQRMLNEQIGELNRCLLRYGVDVLD